MSIASFSTPTDFDILQKIIENDTVIGFVGKGSIYQNVKETLYVRTVKIKLNKEEVLKNVIYFKKGIKWFFKSIETKEQVSESAIENE